MGTNYVYHSLNVGAALTTRSLTITTGERQYLALPGGGTFEMDHTAKASVTASRPDGARVEGETKICLCTPAAGVIQVETRSWISQVGMLLVGEVTVDGRVLFERRWQK